MSVGLTRPPRLERETDGVGGPEQPGQPGGRGRDSERVRREADAGGAATTAPTDGAAEPDNGGSGAAGRGAAGDTGGVPEGDTVWRAGRRTACRAGRADPDGQRLPGPPVRDGHLTGRTVAEAVPAASTC